MILKKFINIVAININIVDLLIYVKNFTLDSGRHYSFRGRGNCEVKPEPLDDDTKEFLPS